MDSVVSQISEKTYKSSDHILGPVGMNVIVTMCPDSNRNAIKMLNSELHLFNPNPEHHRILSEPKRMPLHLLHCQGLAVADYSFALGSLEAGTPSTFAPLGFYTVINNIQVKDMR